MLLFVCEKHWASLFRRLRRRRNCFKLRSLVESSKTSVGPPLPGPLVRLKRWLAAHHVTLMTIADTPHSIALGSAIGIRSEEHTSELQSPVHLVCRLLLEKKN